MAKLAKQLEVACDVNLCYDTFQSTVSSLKGFEIKRADKNGHTLEIKTGSWINTPVTMNVSMSAISPAQTLLSIEAKTASLLDVTGANEKAVMTVLPAFDLRLREAVARQMTKAEIFSGLRCPKCGRSLQPGARFCPDDGTPIGKECPKCKSVNEPVARFCQNCGNSL